MESKYLQINCTECDTVIKLRDKNLQRVFCEECNHYFRVIIRPTIVSQKGALTSEEFHFGRSKIVEGEPEIEVKLL
jgi:hypothetical protein